MAEDEGAGAGLIEGPDGRPRCEWAGGAGEMLRYHDEEWGFPVGDDRLLFEKICLEGFQAGLSWSTILAKRPAFRSAFAGFDHRLVAGYDDSDVERLLGDAGIVRHRGKIEATINNARRMTELDAEGLSLAALVWGHEPDPDEVDPPQSLTTSPASRALSADLKRRGFRFVGPTTMFALMQSMGLINDHHPSCAIRPLVAQARDAFPRPG